MIFLHVEPNTERNSVETIIIFLPILSANIDSKIKPTTLPTNYADMIEFRTYS